MFGRLRARMTYANTMSTIAVFVALSGTSYAAVKIPRKSVGTAQLKSNAVTGAKVKNNSLRAADFAKGQLPAGAQGPAGAAGTNGLKGDKGDQGLAGAPGSAKAYARVGADGTLEPSVNPVPHSKGVDAADVQHETGVSNNTTTGDGVYCFGGLGFNVANAVVTAGNADTFNSGDFDRFATVAVFRGQDLGRCDAAHNQVRVAMVDKDGSLQNHPFYIWFTE